MNSMRDYLNADTLLNTAKMCLNNQCKIVLVVEGPYDRLVLKDHTSENMLILCATAGRQQVVEAARKSIGQPQSARIRFVIDRDYADYKISNEQLTSNIFVSEYHDLFMDLMDADKHVIEKVVEVRSAGASRRQIPSKPILQTSKIVSKAINYAHCLSAFKAVDARHSLNFDFKRFRFSELNENNCTPRTVVSIMMHKCQDIQEDPEDLIQESEELYDKYNSQNHPFIGDHDFFSALSRVMSLYGIKIKDRHLQEDFIIGITCRTIRNIRLYNDVTTWADTCEVVGFTCPS